jgi:hypothetical protein
MRRHQEVGVPASAAEVARFAHLLGHAPRSYRDFATEAGPRLRGA